jgi:hypothetical protein
MADIKGYVNPRSFGNTEPNEFLHMDIFFEQELWDRYIATIVKRRKLHKRRFGRRVCQFGRPILLARN